LRALVLHTSLSLAINSFLCNNMRRAKNRYHVTRSLRGCKLWTATPLSVCPSSIEVHKVLQSHESIDMNEGCSYHTLQVKSHSPLCWSKVKSERSQKVTKGHGSKQIILLSPPKKALKLLGYYVVIFLSAVNRRSNVMESR